MYPLSTFWDWQKSTNLYPYFEGQRIIAAVSGGADSLCLLHILQKKALTEGHGVSSPTQNNQPPITDGDRRFLEKESRPPHMEIHVATLDHGLRGAAGADDVAFVVKTAQAWGLPVHSAQRDVKAIAQQYKLGIEEAARLTRYSFLAETAQAINASAIITGHTADDQIETLLMHLIRGTGLAGLTGMKPAVPLSQQHLLPGTRLPAHLMLIRPLLPFTRSEIEDYCRKFALTPRHDHTNDDPHYLRNRVRHELLPLLETFNPNIRSALNRTGQLLHDDYTKLQVLVDEQWQALLHEQSPSHVALDREGVREFDQSPAILRSILRRAIQTIDMGSTDISLATIENALSVALQGDTGSQSDLPGHIRLRVDYEAIVIEQRHTSKSGKSQAPELPANTSYTVQLPGQTPLPNSAWVLEARHLSPAENPADYFAQPLTAVLTVPPGSSIHLRTRQPGDRFALYGLNGHTQKLKKTFATLKIPQIRRDTLPLLTINGEIAWFSYKTHNTIAETFAIHEYSNDRVLFLWHKA